MSKPTAVELFAYTAGILDGEGCFSIQKSGGTYRTTIQVQMTSRAVPAWLHENFGGGHFSSRPATAQTEELFIWVLASKPKIVFMIPWLLPYLKVKNLPATILLEFCTKFNVGRGGTYSVDVCAEMDKYHQLMMLANSKGPGSNALKDRILKIAQGGQDA